MTSNPTNFGPDYLQNRIAGEFTLAKHIGVLVESAEDATVILRAPLTPNSNYKGTAFGGSLYSVAVLTGWAWVTRYLASRDLAADAVIQESNMRFLVPVRGELRARAAAPSDLQIDKFRKMLQRAGRGRIRLQVDIHCENALSAQFDGVFAAAVRQ
ncbi:MAG: thioesterase domain-containing protein [Pseudomonadota bacterium]|nr:thioesterase domain-containing protein [Pseudomonadota bacterium]